MYLVSDAYRQQIKQTVRNVSYIKIQFGLVDPDATSNAYIYYMSERLPFATIPELVDNNSVSTLYSTLETNFWLLDGSMKVLPKSGIRDYQGFISQQLSSEDTCSYGSSVSCTIKFRQGQYNFRGFSFIFDTIQNNYPTEATITGFLNGEQNFTTTISIDAAEFVSEVNVPIVDQITITFTKNKLPNRRLRIQDIILGVVKKITEETLTSSTWKRSNDLMNTVLPLNEFSFTFYDTKEEYNPDNPEGVWEYLDSGQQIDFKYGYQLNDGTIEWVPGSTLFTDGTPSVSNSGILSEVTFNAVSRLQMLTDVYDVATYYPSGQTYYEIEELLLQWSGIESTYYQLNERLKNYKFTGVLPELPVRELLQLIANAGLCLLTINRDGHIVFTDRPLKEIEFSYNLTDIYDATPSISKYPYLKTLSVSVNNYNVSSEVTNMSTLEVQSASNTTYVLTYESSTDISIEVTSGLTLVKTNYIYARKASVTVTGTGTITIKGKAIQTSTSKVQRDFNVVGEDCELSNELICNVGQAVEYINWMGEILNKRNVYSFSDRGFPEVDIAHTVGVDTQFTDQKKVLLTSSTIEYNGALSGNTEVLG